ncbi:MAG: GtrA family protein [Coxiellaceae bacterium]|nr:GtrA family protein [Coxiellaceae bacterium]
MSSFYNIKIVRYLSVGAMTFALYYLLLWLAFSVMQWQYALSVTIAYLFSILFHFVSNRHITFRVKKGGISRQFMRYLVVVFVNYIIQQLSVRVLYKVLATNFYFSNFIGLVLTTLVGYVLINYWVFANDQELMKSKEAL